MFIKRVKPFNLDKCIFQLSLFFKDFPLVKNINQLIIFKEIYTFLL